METGDSITRNSKGQFLKGVPSSRKMPLIDKVCPTCHKEFIVKPSNKLIVYCSRSCGRRGLATRPRGTKFTPEHRAKLVEAKMKFVENHPDWKGPRYIIDRNLLVKSEYKHLDSRYHGWMMEVKNRDGWKCRISNSDCSGCLEAHHILSWKDHEELRYEPNNGITLCRFHHPRKREDVIKLSPYFQNIVMSNSK